MLLESLFFEIGAVIIIATAVAFIMHSLKQPMVIAYIIAGVLIGPGLLAMNNTPEIYAVMSEIGIAFLLFTVGLGMNWRTVKQVGLTAIVTGTGQMIAASGLGFLLGLWLGFDPLTAILVAVAFGFSSTIIVVKLLGDKEDLYTLYGRISIGFLLVQDLFAMIALLILGAYGQGDALSQIITISLLKGAIVVITLFLMWTFLGPRLVRYASRSQELLLLFALAWCFAIAGILHYFGFGIELGALLAGLSLSGTIYEKEIEARIRPLRDFFLVMFFVLLGTNLDISSLAGLSIPIVLFSLFVLIGNPLTLMILMRGLGHHPQTAFLTGTSIAQVSEFSFIMLGAAFTAGLIGQEPLVLATAVALITIAGSAYLIKYNEQLYARLRPYLRWAEKDQARHEILAESEAAPAVLLFGYRRMGTVLLEQVKKIKRDYIIVDFDPNIINRLHEDKEPAIYGDASDEDFLSDIEAHKSKIIISTIPSVTVSLSILAFLRSKRYRGIRVVTAKTPEDATECYQAGATYVIVPSVLGAEKFKEILDLNRLGVKTWKHFAKKEAESYI